MQKPKLWHGSVYPFKGDYLDPHPTGQFRDIAPVVFASSEQAQAAMFAVLDWHKINGPILSGVLNGVRYVVVPDRDYYLCEPRKTTLLEFPSENTFVKHEKCSDTEWVSFSRVPIGDCIKHHFNGIPDLMALNIQILFFDAKRISREQIMGQMLPEKTGSWVAPALALHNMIKVGLLIHENAVQGINPHNYNASALHELGYSIFRTR